MAEQAAALNERAASCHERVACPACRARVGQRCVRRGNHPSWGKPLKHSHPERLRADGIALR